MISKDTGEIRQRTNGVDTLIRIWSVTHQIAHTPDSIHPASCIKHGFKGRVIGMDIGDDQDAHLCYS